MSSTEVYLTGFTAFGKIVGVSILVTISGSGKKKVRLRRLNNFEKEEIIKRKKGNLV